ncbi:MAG: flagellar hook-length control protein FliK [Rhodospirillales bacterium]
MDEMAVNDRDAVALFNHKTAGKSKDGAGEEFLHILKGVNGAPGAARGPAHEKHDDGSLSSMFGSKDQDTDPRESAAARDDMHDDGGADDDPVNRDDPRPRESASSGADDSRNSSADTAAHGHNDSGADTADRGETDAKMSKNAENSGESGKDNGNAGAGRNQDSGENSGADTEAAAAAAAAQGQNQVVQGVAESAAGQAQRGAQGQAGEGQNQTAAQAAAQAAGAQAKKSGANDNGDGDRKKAQEQNIATKLNPGQAVKVEVKTSDEAKTLISRPVIAQVSEDGDAAAPQTQRAGGSGAQNAPTIAQQAQQAQNQNQNQKADSANAGPAQQIQVQMAAAQAAAKGQAMSGPQAAGSAGGASAGGESAQGPNQAAQTRSETPQQAEQARQGKNAHDTHQTRARVVEQISVQIAKAAAAGRNDSIKITLKPAELGRVEIQIEMTHDGRAAAVVTADNKETLDMLRRDAGELAKALQDAGLKTGADDLSFNLRDKNANADAGDGKAESGLLDGDDDGEGEDDGLADMGDMPLPEDARLPQSVGVRGLAGVNLVA